MRLTLCAQRVCIINVSNLADYCCRRRALGEGLIASTRSPLFLIFTLSFVSPAVFPYCTHDLPYMCTFKLLWRYAMPSNALL